MKRYIIIPTYNERKNIELLVPRVFALLPDVHILVVDDASPDGTQEIVASLQQIYPRLELYPHNQKAGFARAYIDAMLLLLEREHDLQSITMMDADASHDPEHLPTMLELLDQHDLVIGSRYVPRGGVIGWEVWRRALSYFGNIYLRAVSNLRIKDITGGYNTIRADALRRIPLAQAEAKGYAFQFLLKYLLMKQGARAIESPIVFRNRLEGESKMSHHIITEALILPWKMKRLS